MEEFSFLWLLLLRRGQAPHALLRLMGRLFVSPAEGRVVIVKYLYGKKVRKTNRSSKNLAFMLQTKFFLFLNKGLTTSKLLFVRSTSLPHNSPIKFILNKQEVLSDFGIVKFVLKWKKSGEFCLRRRRLQ